MVGWRIYYGDGSVFSNTDGEAWDAPRQDVQAIVQQDSRTGWRLCSGRDYFYYDVDRGGWNTSDQVWDHMICCRQPLVLFGRQLSDDAWRKLFAQIKNELGEKQGWLMTEDRRGCP